MARPIPRAPPLIKATLSFMLRSGMLGTGNVETRWPASHLRLQPADAVEPGRHPIPRMDAGPFGTSRRKYISGLPREDAAVKAHQLVGSRAHVPHEVARKRRAIR